jgi:7,8-dihydroneopterin aldolase/epimerase/oxygenase
MFCIQLENLVFKAFHGLYPEEKIIGGTFIVNLSVKFIAIKKNNFQISDTVNYETLFQIVSKHINEPTDLLENISVNITNDIFNQLQQVQFVDISITKKNPPIFHFIGDVTVNYQSKRD